MLEQCNDTYRVLKYILFSPGCTISEISASLVISHDYLINILKMILSQEYHFVNLVPSHPKLNKTEKDVFAISRKSLITKVNWYFKTESSGLVPFSILDQMEKRLLKSLISTWNLAQCKKIGISNFNIHSEDSTTAFIFDVPVNDLVDNEINDKLKLSIHQRYYIKIYFYGLERFIYVKPIGFLRNNISGEWFLICQDELRIYKTFPLEDIGKVEISPNKFLEGVPINKDVIKSKLFTKMTDIELVVQNHPTALDKLKKYLSHCGKFTEEESGFIRFSGEISNIDDFKVLLLRLGSSVKVIKPDWLRNDIVNEIRTLIISNENNC